MWDSVDMTPEDDNKTPPWAQPWASNDKDDEEENLGENQNTYSPEDQQLGLGNDQDNSCVIDEEGDVSYGYEYNYKYEEGPSTSYERPRIWRAQLVEQRLMD